MPQDIKALSGEVLTPRTPAEKEDFDNMLGAVQDLYITMQVLIILDAQYLGRFWFDDELEPTHVDMLLLSSATAATFL